MYLYSVSAVMTLSWAKSRRSQELGNQARLYFCSYVYYVN